ICPGRCDLSAPRFFGLAVGRKRKQMAQAAALRLRRPRPPADAGRTSGVRNPPEDRRAKRTAKGGAVCFARTAIGFVRGALANPGQVYMGSRASRPPIRALPVAEFRPQTSGGGPQCEDSLA